ncbi:hypothetical protein [Legionella bononiensis]|uniref:Uncharacterized protein n=1 Tax=Legionella bononiensis TaxID=2793102 RepID=A0ABS1W993_9GAMM|nr:hypothetical protein [Legionella bononiensis]MBL7479678.1 hypothetical protein [Legionella bononiensis]MBL7525810.1 hypothetical protein [Legionella bononiensis]MBL7561992.1 hypothetical protein [Legionella bononiensis]
MVKNPGHLKKGNIIVNQPIGEENSNQLASTGWLLLVLFFVGAISSRIVACYGIRCNRECRVNQTDQL